MDIHEYQAKEILARFGVPVPRGGLAYRPDELDSVAASLFGTPLVTKPPAAEIASGVVSGLRARPQIRTDHDRRFRAGKAGDSGRSGHQTGPEPNVDRRDGGDGSGKAAGGLAQDGPWVNRIGWRLRARSFQKLRSDFFEEIGLRTMELVKTSRFPPSRMTAQAGSRRRRAASPQPSAR